MNLCASCCPSPLLIRALVPVNSAHPSLPPSIRALVPGNCAHPSFPPFNWGCGCAVGAVNADLMELKRRVNSTLHGMLTVASSLEAARARLERKQEEAVRL